MKKLFLLFFTLSLFLIAPTVKSQTNSSDKNYIYKVFDGNLLNTTKPTKIITPYFNTQMIDYLQIMVKYVNCTGDSTDLKLYPSPDGSTFTTSSIIKWNKFQWKNGDGALKTITDTVSLNRFLVGGLESIADTTTRMTGGLIYMWIKPHFK